MVVVKIHARLAFVGKIYFETIIIFINYFISERLVIEMSIYLIESLRLADDDDEALNDIRQNPMASGQILASRINGKC